MANSIFKDDIEEIRKMLDDLEKATCCYAADEESRTEINLGVMAVNDAVAEVLIIAEENLECEMCGYPHKKCVCGEYDKY